MRRQQAWETDQEKKRQDMEFEHNKTMKHYFKPKIGKSEAIIRSKRKGQVVESKQELVERLSIKDKEMIDENREIRQEAQDAKYDFQPEINNVSKALAAKAPTIEELSTNPRGMMVRERARQRVEEKRREECR